MEEAQNLLGLRENPDHTVGVNTDVIGWSWRGLALSRINHNTKSEAAFRQAEKDGLAEIPQSRTWREWDAIIESYALAGLWKKAFEAAVKPPDQYARLGLQLKVLELYHKMEDPERP